MKTRAELGDLLRTRKAVRGVEIGVNLGEFAASILSRSCLRSLLLVDPWAGHRGGDGDEALAQCKLVMEPFGQRVSYLRQTSPAAAEHVCDGSVEWIYLDGSHTYTDVTADLGAWWPKLKRGGVYAGHDYCARHAHYGVIQAVDEFAAAHTANFELHIIQDGHWPTWWGLKT